MHDPPRCGVFPREGCGISAAFGATRGRGVMTGKTETTRLAEVLGWCRARCAKPLPSTRAPSHRNQQRHKHEAERNGFGRQTSVCQRRDKKYREHQPEKRRAGQDRATKAEPQFEPERSPEHAKYLASIAVARGRRRWRGAMDMVGRIARTVVAIVWRTMEQVAVQHPGLTAKVKWIDVFVQVGPDIPKDRPTWSNLVRRSCAAAHGN